MQNSIVSRLQLQLLGTLTQPFQWDLQTLSCKAQKNYAERLQNTIRITRQYCSAGTFDQRWRNHSSAICGHWVATHRRIATHYCRTHCLDAAVPTHKASQHMQNTIAQNQQRKQEVTWNHQFNCARKTNRNRRQSGRLQASRAREPTFLRNGSSVYPKKVLCKS